VQYLRNLTIVVPSAQDVREQDFHMPGDVSALQLVLTGDPALIAIVRL
jgi:hypothetical protein